MRKVYYKPSIEYESLTVKFCGGGVSKVPHRLLNPPQALPVQPPTTSHLAQE